MRKILVLMLAMLCLLFAGSAAAERLSFSSIYATCNIPDSYTLITPYNLGQHEDWLTQQKITREALLEDWTARGVQVQAWSKDGDVCIEITAVQDDRALQYYDVDQQTTDNRKVFRLSHTNGAYYKRDGYTYTTAEWSNSQKIGRWLTLKYKRSTALATYRGLQRRTIRNGYTITVDYQVHGRSLKNTDTTALKKIMDGWKFEQIRERPADVVSKVVFTAKPPVESNTGKFTISGTGDAGLRLVGVAMRMSSSDKVLLDTTIGKNGKFAMDVSLPSEGVWLVTLSVENGDAVTEELVFDITTYKKSLLVVNMDAPLPERINEDKLVISGKTLQGTSVQCKVGSFSKVVKVGANGTYKFTVDTSNEGDYEILLTFQKKGFDSRRFTAIANRKLSQQDMMDRARNEAVKPGYATLVEKIKGYTGRTLTYSMYVTNIVKSGDEWVIFMAMSATKTGYKDIVVVTSEDEPDVEIGSKHRLYGNCTGTYLVQNAEEGDKYYPCIELLFFED